MMNKTIIFEVPCKDLCEYKMPREKDIQDCIDAAVNNNTRVELVWHIYNQKPSTYVFPDSTVDEIWDKVEADTMGALKTYYKK